MHVAANARKDILELGPSPAPLARPLPDRERLGKALRLGRYFGTSPQFWINLQARNDLESAKDKLATRIEREVRPRERAA
ncbi:MAG: hypothetical protein ABSD30_07405 [Candidatus Binatus sp.]|jgi:hypothetical protein